VPANALQATDPNTVHGTRSRLAENWLMLEGKPYRLFNYPMFRAVFDGQYPAVLLMTSRQVSKSITLAVGSSIDSCAIPFFQTIYVSPSREQTQRWSQLKLGPIIQHSEKLRDVFVGESVANRVLLRQFLNGSTIALSYAQENADRVRGLSGDRLCIDEVQDILLEAVEPVARECLSNSEYKHMLYAGTPKTFENGIQHLWESSTRSEWVIRCEGCKRDSVIDSEKQLTPTGPKCFRCGRMLNPRLGRWIDFAKSRIKGFHVSRPIMPREVPASWSTEEDKVKAQGRWDDVWDKLTGPNAYALSQFRNEVLGVSDSQGRRIVTIEQLRAACTGPPIAPQPLTQGNAQSITAMAGGMDWSGGGTSFKSRTVQVILGMTPQLKMRLMWFKIYPGLAPVDEVDDAAGTFNSFAGIRLIGCDAGEGHMATDMLRKRMINPQAGGLASKVVKIRYGNPNYYARWDREAGWYMVNRTRVIDAMMMALSRGDFEFPQDPDGKLMEVPFKDILNEFEEITTMGTKVWRHAPTRPDDFLHALCFARIALQASLGQLDLTP
jgi:hypothetical protein